MEGTDVCFAPVLALEEAPAHPHNTRRKAFVEVEGVVAAGTRSALQPHAGRSAAPARDPRRAHREVLRDWGFSAGELAALLRRRRSANRRSSMRSSTKLWMPRLAGAERLRKTRPASPARRYTVRRQRQRAAARQLELERDLVAGAAGCRAATDSRRARARRRARPRRCPRRPRARECWSARAASRADSARARSAPAGTGRGSPRGARSSRPRSAPTARSDRARRAGFPADPKLVRALGVDDHEIRRAPHVAVVRLPAIFREHGVAGLRELQPRERHVALGRSERQDHARRRGFGHESFSATDRARLRARVTSERTRVLSARRRRHRRRTTPP